MHEIENAVFTKNPDMQVFQNCSGIRVFTDGGIRPCNPGGASGYAFSVSTEDRPDVPVYEFRAASKPWVENTVMLAEYYAMFRALQWLEVNGLRDHRVNVFSDAQFVVKQINAGGPVRKSPYYTHFAVCTQYLVTLFSDLTVTWIRREGNVRADHLADLALVDLGYAKGKVKRKEITGKEPDHGHYVWAPELRRLIDKNVQQKKAVQTG